MELQDECLQAILEKEVTMPRRERDWEIAKKMNNLKNELKQTQIQLIDVPLEFTNNLSEEELNRYFNSPKVNKKYRLKTK